LSCSSQAFIYEIKILERYSPELQANQYFIGCSDFHDKVHQANKEQSAVIERIFANCDKCRTKALVEDLSSPNSKGCASCGRFYINSRGGVLGGLTQKGKSMGVDIDNLEFRYCRVTTLGPVLNNIRANMFELPSVASIYMDKLRQEVMQNIHEIQGYNDGPELAKLYNGLIADIAKKMQTLKIDAHGSMTVAQFLAHHARDDFQRLELIKQLLTFDSELLDIKIVHETLAAKNKKHVVAIAGGSHIEKSARMLEKVGFKPVTLTQISYAQERDLKSCLGSNIIDGAYCIKPQPIKIDFIEQIFVK
jgi:hypothetical protein